MSSSSSLLATRRERGRVLVAEDNEEMRSILCETLERDGHEVLAVADGAALLVELARNHRFHYDTVDVVVADVRMPLCSGLQVLETVRSVRPRLPFVLLTAFGDREMHDRARDFGAVLLDKPVALNHLRSVVADKVASRHR